MKKLFKLLKIAFPLILFSLLFLNIYQNWNEVKIYFEEIRLLWLIASCMVALLIYPQAALIWHLLTKSFQEKISFRHNLYIFIISNTSRYIPGTVWQYIGRVELGKRIGNLQRKKTLVMIVYEVFLLLLGAGTLSLLNFSGAFVKNLGITSLIIIFFLSLLAFHPSVLNFCIKFLVSISKNKITLPELKFNSGKLIFTYLAVLVNFILNGLALLFLYFAFNQNLNYGHFLFFTSAYAFSWALGFITPIAPAGFGVVEVSLALTLSGIMPLTLASAIAISFRFISTLVEMLTFLFVLKISYEKK